MMAKKKQTATADKPIHPIDLTPLVQQAELHDLRLLESVSVVSLTGAMPPEVTQTITVGSKQGNEGRSIMARITLLLTGANADGTEGLRVGATFGLTYNFPSLDGVGDEMTNGFCRVIGLNNAWPYWREFVQSMIGRMGLPPFHVPLLRLNQLVETKDQQRDIAKPSAKSKRKAKQ